MANQPTTFDRIRFFNDASVPVNGFSVTPSRAGTPGNPFTHLAPLPPGTEVKEQRTPVGNPQSDHPDTVDVVVQATPPVQHMVHAPIMPVASGIANDGIRRVNVRLHGSPPNLQLEVETIHQVQTGVLNGMRYSVKYDD